jgi:hypothetical protein
MVVPCDRQLLRPAEPEQAGERRHMLDVNALSPLQATGDQRGGSGYHIFDGEYFELACVVVQRDRARQRAPERVKQVDANRARFVD